MKAYVTSDFSEEALKRLKETLKDEVIYESWRETRNLYFKDEDLIAKVKQLGVEILICEGDNIKKKVIEDTNLKIIGSTRDDPNNVAISIATQKGIPVLFAPKRNTIAVAELAVTLILMLVRNIHKVDRVIHSPDFKVNEFSDYVKYYNMFKGSELTGKTVGIVGLGMIGFEVAKRLVPYEVQFLIYDPYVSTSKLQAINGKSVSLDVLMSQSDIITLHCPPIDETDGMISAELLRKMKPTAYFVNLARASVTNEEELLQLLKEKKIAGAALDVFSTEPVDHENPFLKLENVIVTPHLGGDTYETNHRHGMMIVDGIEKILNNKIPDNIKNPEVLKGFQRMGMPSQGSSIPRIPLSIRFYAPQSQKIIEICLRMLNQKIVTGSAGNVSMRVKLPTGEDAFLVTPSTVDYREMTIDDMVLIDNECNVLLGTRNPTSERVMHVSIYLAREDVNAIIHSHAPYSTTLSIARMPIGPIVDEIIPFIGGCEVAAYAMAGTKEIAANAVAALGDNYACFLANHGNICVGKDLDHAFTVLTQVEIASRIQYQAALLGTVYALPEDAEEHEKEIFGIMKDAMGVK